MIVVHRIALRPTDEQRQYLHRLGVDVPAGVALPGGGDPYVVFDVDENHPNWATLRRLFEHWDVGDLASTRFSSAEIDDAHWLELGIEWHHGYPQPNDANFGYLEATYDLAEYCARCGIGLKQKAPFQMKREPKWGRRGILQLNWVFDEFFVAPEVWAGVFEPHGIASRPVINTSGAVLRTVVQLVVREEVNIVTADLPVEEAACTECGRTKYLPVTRGPFPALRREPSAPMAKTEEYFGSGGSANNGVVISRPLGRDLRRAGVRGASLRPVAR